MNQGLRWGLISSAIVIVCIALIIFIIIMYRVFKLKKKIKNDQRNVANQIADREGEIKLVQRQDYGEPIKQLWSIIPNSIDHENVEVCINTCIRNEFKNALFVGKVGLYELITLSNKANVTSYVLEESFNSDLYQKTKDKINIEHSIIPIKTIDQKFDAILILDDISNFASLFEQYHQWLNEKGMIIIANTKKNKYETKKLISKIKQFKYKYDILKWHNGFVLIVK